MSYLLVAWVSWACPGGSWFSPAWPAAFRPLLCTPSARIELYDPARARQARARVAEIGPGATLSACRGLRCSPPLSSWSQVVTFKEIQ